MLTSTQVIIAVVSVLFGAISSGICIKLLDRLRRKDAESEAGQIIHQAKLDAANTTKQAELDIKEKALAQQAEVERELRKSRDELRERERLLDKRTEAVEQQADHLRKQERMTENTQRRLTEKIEDFTRRGDELAKVLDMQRQTLHELSGLSADDAQRRLLEMLDSELQQETGAIILKHKKRMEEVCEQQSRDMLLTAIQRYAAAHTAESTTSTVDIPNDEMKGRIIGREGRNIRSFEKETGVDVIIDDTPGVVIVSGFDPVRREVARVALNKLIADGRIHPTRIEELVAETREEIEQHIQKMGEEAAQETDVPGLHPRLVYMLGRLQFRSSYSQNVLRHCDRSGVYFRDVGRNDRLGRHAGSTLRPAARHRQGGRPRDGGRSPPHRSRPAQAARRTQGGGACGPRAPRRDHHRVPVHDARRDRRRLQRLTARGPPRNAGTLHQADGGTGNHRQRFPGGGAGLRHSGRPGVAGDCQRQGHRRQPGGQDLPRHCQGV